MRGFPSTLAVAVILMIAGAAAHAQTPVRTEVVRPVQASPAFNGSGHPDVAVTVRGSIPPPTTQPDVITDLSTLPPAVARMRERILSAARTGQLDAVVAVMQSSQGMPIFSLNGDGDRDPVAYRRQNYPDSGGVEILGQILTDILETGFVHVDQGTAEEMYVWPYFSRAPLQVAHAGAEGRPVQDRHRKRRLQGHKGECRRLQ